MSHQNNDQQKENLVERAADVVDYFVSKPPAQIVENLLDTVKKTDSMDAWDRLDEYVRECEKVRFDIEYRPDEVSDVY